MLLKPATESPTPSSNDDDDGDDDDNDHYVEDSTTPSPSDEQPNDNQGNPKPSALTPNKDQSSKNNSSSRAKRAADDAKVISTPTVSVSFLHRISIKMIHFIFNCSSCVSPGDHLSGKPGNARDFLQVSGKF